MKMDFNVNYTVRDWFQLSAPCPCVAPQAVPMYDFAMPRTEDKGRLNEVFAAVAKGLAHANRLELLELLAQGERDVESLAQGSSMSMANTSHHLKLLRQCGLIQNRQEGQRVIYRLADDRVISLMALLHGLAMKNLPALDRLLAERFPSDASSRPVYPAELQTLLGQEGLRIFDLRPQAEFMAGHVPSAELASVEALQDLPPARGGETCVVYCRGTFCLAPHQAAAILAAKGYTVRNLDGGFPAWRISGNAVETDAAETSGAADALI